MFFWFPNTYVESRIPEFTAFGPPIPGFKSKGNEQPRFRNNLHVEIDSLATLQKSYRFFDNQVAPLLTLRGEFEQAVVKPVEGTKLYGVYRTPPEGAVNLFWDLVDIAPGKDLARDTHPSTHWIASCYSTHQGSSTCLTRFESKTFHGQLSVSEDNLRLKTELVRLVESHLQSWQCNARAP